MTPGWSGFSFQNQISQIHSDQGAGSPPPVWSQTLLVSGVVCLCGSVTATEEEEEYNSKNNVVVLYSANSERITDGCKLRFE